MSFLHGCIVDKQAGTSLAAKVHILDGGGRPVFPAAGVRKVGPGLPGFYADGEFVVDLPPGRATVFVERGTEYKPFEATVRMNWGATTELVIPLDRWTFLPDEGWFPGNTHIHYDEHETDPDARLRLDPQVHGLHVTVVSILQRGDMDYATNRYPVGFLSDFSSAHHAVDCGEECRHNRDAWEIGYGHVIFLSLQDPVLPVSRGLLIDSGNPDYPPLCYACDDANRQGAISIWCHNGAGMEAPVAAVLGKLDAFHLFDPYWVMPEEYTIWYHMLNCGIRLPASTGSDWYVCSNNRVYVNLEGQFSYENWLLGLKTGKTFITNGPALFLRIGDVFPGATYYCGQDDSVEIEVSWRSFSPIDRVEIIYNGRVIGTHTISPEDGSGVWRTSVALPNDGWLAARIWSQHRDSFFQHLFAHTSPIWVRTGRLPDERTDSAAFFVKSLDASMAWVDNVARFDNQQQRTEVLDLFRAAQTAYRSML